MTWLTVMEYLAQMTIPKSVPNARDQLVPLYLALIKLLLLTMDMFHLS